MVKIGVHVIAIHQNSSFAFYLKIAEIEGNQNFKIMGLLIIFGAIIYILVGLSLLKNQTRRRR
ncbi:hypothetical protein GCM10026987_32860 [Belliella aquatica]|uniref:Uncharacterized protein n=1 Tax=Belliella aquatica TaxID=1323734 RepID=A0ABQ1M047_9BACT|nr:hypothetical protein GCM10010993_09290 [Belliella aquatica]